MRSSRPTGDQGAMLAEESVLVNVVTPYQAVHFSLTPDAVRIDWPQSILGIVPVGRVGLDVPLDDLERFRLTHTLILSRLLVFAAVASIPFLIDLPRWGIGIIVILAAWLLLVSVVGAVEVRHAGERTVIPVCLLQSKAVRDFIDQVDQATWPRERARS